jgi:hypothetical protein
MDGKQYLLGMYGSVTAVLIWYGTVYPKYSQKYKAVINNLLPNKSFYTLE